MVDPWGICLRRGIWVLVGYCHLRESRRTFHVDRVVDLTVSSGRPRTPDYEVPADFDIAEIAREQVWEHRLHQAMDVDVRLSPALAPMAERLFPNASVRPVGEEARVRVRASYLDGLLRRVLSLGDGARVESPPDAVRRAREMVRAVAQAHGAEGRAP